MEYDLTKHLSLFLDAHLILPLVDFLKTKSLYPEDQLNKARDDILEQTGLSSKKQQLQDQITELSKQCEHITEYINKKEQSKESGSSASVTTGEGSTETPVTATVSVPSISSIIETVTPQLLNSLYRLSKLNFEIGNYKLSRDYLEVYLTVSPAHSEKHLNALWGMLEADILTQNWSSCLSVVSQLKQQIDLHGSPVDQLYQRAWLVHRVLFIYFNYADNKPLLVDILLDEKYLIATQTAAPYILRYLAVAIITNKKKQQSTLFQKHLHQLVRINEQEAYTYSDPITLFIHNLYVKFNFEVAQTQLSNCQTVIGNDYFLHNALEEFMECARVCIFETYCNIHENIDIDMLSRNLGIPAESSEKWIVEAIRNARFNAKIDSANNQIKMFSQHNNSYRQVINKTKPLFNLGIEIVVGINDSKSQQSRKLDQNNRQNKNRSQQRGGASSTSATTTPATTTTAQPTAQPTQNGTPVNAN